MDVILHVGAHRTATTSFQDYMRRNADPLERAGLGFWGPRRTRGGVLAGVLPVPGAASPERQFEAARARIAAQLDRARARGTAALLVSDENILGSARGNLRARALYPAAGPRMAAHLAAFAGRIDRVVLSVRALEGYWPSALAYAVARGHAPPGPAARAALAARDRGWQAVIRDLAAAAPGIEIVVTEHARFAAHPEWRLARMVDRPVGDLPAAHARVRRNRGPDLAGLNEILARRGGAPVQGAGGACRSWQPFDAAELQVLRARDRADMAWLADGAGGLARLAPAPVRPPGEAVDGALPGRPPPPG